MKYIGEYSNRQVFWVDYNKYSDQLPDSNWICLAISNKPPDIADFDKFARTSIAKNILEFKGWGQFAEDIHDHFDGNIVIMETMENHAEIDVMTTWHNDETLADTFWQCFFATCLPDTLNVGDIKIICMDLDGIDRFEELQVYIKNFKLGWIPA